jgi:hypothetical protein
MDKPHALVEVIEVRLCMCVRAGMCVRGRVGSWVVSRSAYWMAMTMKT